MSGERLSVVAGEGTKLVRAEAGAIPLTGKTRRELCVVTVDKSDGRGAKLFRRATNGTDDGSTRVHHFMMSVSASPIRAAQSYRELIVWRKAVDLTTAIYRITRTFPGEARFGLASQLQRAAVSIPSNIAEGNRRRSIREYRHFLAIAHGSLAEVDTQLEIAIRIGYIARETITDLLDLIDHLGRMLTKLSQSLHP